LNEFTGEYGLFYKLLSSSWAQAENFSDGAKLFHLPSSPSIDYFYSFFHFFHFSVEQRMRLLWQPQIGSQHMSSLLLANKVNTADRWNYRNTRRSAPSPLVRAPPEHCRLRRLAGLWRYSQPNGSYPPSVTSSRLVY